MGELSINLVTLIISLVVLMYLVKGIIYEFSPEAMYNSAIAIINILLFLSSLLFSTIIFKNLVLQSNYLSFSINQGILATLKRYEMLISLIVYLMLLLTIYLILRYVRSLLDCFIKSILIHLCESLKDKGRLVKSFVGILIETPKVFVITTVLVLIINFANSFYPVNPLASPSMESPVYNYIYSYSVSPIMNSSTGKNIPAFFWQSMDVISTVISSSQSLENSNLIKSLGLIRFQLESRSNDDINNAAREIVGDETKDSEKAHLIYKWIGSNIKYDWQKYDDIIYSNGISDKFGAVNAFSTHKGVCEDYSDLYAAMARAVGLKVRIIVGQGLSAGSWGGHAWNEVYLPDEKKWIPLDTTWAVSGNYFDNKNFYNDHSIEAIAGEW